MKLDVSGLKIALRDWLACSFEERSVLCHLPIESSEEKETFTAYVDFLSRRDQGRPVEVTAVIDSALWDPANVPAPVAQKSASGFTRVTIEEWRRWQPLQRYALYKTAISKSQPEAFADVLDELRASSALAAEG
jgi:hypothetical protein